MLKSSETVVLSSWYTLEYPSFTAPVPESYCNPKTITLLSLLIVTDWILPVPLLFCVNVIAFSIVHVPPTNFSMLTWWLDPLQRPWYNANLSPAPLRLCILWPPKSRTAPSIGSIVFPFCDQEEPSYS